MTSKSKKHFVDFYRLVLLSIAQRRPQTFILFVTITILSYAVGVSYLDTTISSVETPNEEVALFSEGFKNVLLDECPTLTSSELSNPNSEEIISAVEEASATYKVERELIYAVIIAESRCKNMARSRAGAMGLMQLMPRTAAWLGVKSPYGVRDNIFGGAKYLSHLLGLFDGDMKMALAAYNAGPTKVKRYSSVPPYKETRNYIYKVDGYYQRLLGSSI